MSRFEIKMPKLGESITEGTIISWTVKVGDDIKEDDVLFEVNTAKVSAEIPSPVAGKIIEILFKEGDTVSVGTVVAIVQLSGEEDAGEPAATQTASPPAATPADADPTPATVQPSQIDQAAETSQAAMEAPAAPATPAAKTAKAAADRWYSPIVLSKAKDAGIGQDELDGIPGTGFSGRLTKRDIEVYIQQQKEGKPAAAPAAPAAPAGIQAQATPATPVTPAGAPAPAPVATPQPGQQPAKATPAAATPVAGSADVEVIPMDPVRRIIADRMVASKQISPHVTNVVEADVTNLVRWRERNKDAFKEREGISLTFMPAIAEAVAQALIRYPRVNASVDGYNILQKKQINIGIAVSLDNGNLIVPVIRQADQLSLKGLALSINALAAKARKNTLAMDDIQGGTFTITNFGTFKSLFGTPIINQPEVAILGVGVVEKKPAVIETPDGDMIAIRHKMYLSLSYDHRVIDGSLGGNFLKAVSDYLENWPIQ